METGYKVCDAMTEQPITVPPSTLLDRAAQIMAEHHVGALVVKDASGMLGIVTEQDFVRKAIAPGLNVAQTPVKSIMVTNLHTISPEADVFEALIAMRDFNIRHLLVMHEKQFVGLLTLKDILKIQPQLFELLVDKIELREAERKPINRVAPDEGICEQCGEYTDALRDIKGSMVCPNCRS